jgi:cullin-associated NEDD8-dissociated protein 1
LQSVYIFSLKHFFLFSGTRNVVAECLGKLCLIEPHRLLPDLRLALASPSALRRTTVVTAMKFTISDQVRIHGQDGQIHNRICKHKMALKLWLCFSLKTS